MKRSKAKELTAERVNELWLKAWGHVMQNDLAAARLVIGESLPSEAKALEVMIQKRDDAANANRMKFNQGE